MLFTQGKTADIASLFDAISVASVSLSLSALCKAVHLL